MAFENAVDDKIREAVSSVNKEPILVFCSKSDEPYAQSVYPADNTSTISVAAATSRGRIGTEASTSPDLIVLGEQMPARTPNYYTGNQDHVSGSSVATALATGMTSLILMLARTKWPKEWGNLKQKKELLNLFKSLKLNESSSSAFVKPDIFLELKNLERSIERYCASE